MKKRMLPLVMALALCLGLTIPVLAEEAEEAPLVLVASDRAYYSGDFHEGLAFAKGESADGSAKYGYIDKNMETVIPFQYDSAGDFSEGMAAVEMNDKWGFINKAGELVIPCQYELVTMFSDGLAGVVRNGKGGFIDKTGKEVIACTYDSTSYFCDGLAGVQANGKWGFINKNGEEIIPCQYDGGKNFSEGITTVAQGDKYGFVDQTGKEIIPFQYDYADGFMEGLAVVARGDKYGFVDKNGKEVIPCQYEGVGYFSDGIAPVMQNEKWGYIDKTGKVVIPFQFSRAGSFSEGFAWVTKWINECITFGYIDKTGKEVVPCKADTVFDPDRYGGAFSISDGMGRVVQFVPAPGGGAFSHYGYFAVVGGKEEATEPVEVTASVSNWAKESVVSAAANGLIADGLGDDYTVNITRAQFAAVSVKLYEAMSGETAPAAGESPFTDTSASAVIQAEALGFVGGVGGGKFEPDSLVTREQAATMLSRVYTKLGGEIPAVDATDFADDGDMSGYARDAIAFMSSKEIVGGVGNNKFNPQGNASIEQALVIALRMLEKLK